MTYQPKALWTVIYEIGDPDHGSVERRAIQTQAYSRKQAVNNARYRENLDETFWLISATKEEKTA